MKRTIHALHPIALVVWGMLNSGQAYAQDADLAKKIDELTQQLNQLKAQVQANEAAQRDQLQARQTDAPAPAEKKGMDQWLTIGGDYQFRLDHLRGESVAFHNGMTAVPALKPKNDTLYTNRFTLNLNAKATEHVSVTASLLMHKAFGSNDDTPVTGMYFADRVGVFDGTVGHIPSSSTLTVDRVYATWSNLFDEDMWFSVGRRPSTHGAPSHLRANQSRPGTGGTPALLVDYAFDGMTVGWAPDWEGLPGAYAKFCYGRGFESGLRDLVTNSLKDTDMVGLSVVPIDTDDARVWFQWNRGMNIFDTPAMTGTAMGDRYPSTNLGDIDWLGAGVLGRLKGLGPGDLHYFADVGWSRTQANDQTVFGMGLLTGGLMNPESATNKSGHALYMGLRYDLPSRTRIGFEYNRGSKNWITFAPAANDPWTAKVGTRGQVFETYVIQELNNKPLSSYQAKAFFRFGFQYYDFDYTGSNNWVGAPVKLADVSPTTALPMVPLQKAINAYATFEVKF